MAHLMLNSIEGMVNFDVFTNKNGIFYDSTPRDEVAFPENLFLLS